jgi:hypothetical protein
MEHTSCSAVAEMIAIRDCLIVRVDKGSVKMEEESLRELHCPRPFCRIYCAVVERPWRLIGCKPSGIPF